MLSVVVSVKSIKIIKELKYRIVIVIKKCRPNVYTLVVSRSCKVNQ